MKQDLAKGFLTYTNDENRTTENHYAVLPCGKVLVSSGHGLNCRDFGPKSPDDWGHSSSLPDHAEFIGHYKV
ncbi:hypothetical protein HU733_02545 [Pseudomonas paralactis]|uniref:hypothetical protein n=1 Tax=Pseudomonas paralactis TaxID=1615673 RepID=UPI000852B52F|nr:hypothetical protein [Pseudomonas paralactis]AOS74411.1 hypothetical protein BH711_10820 [Pseudomonas fluorescens]MBC3254359.1 hypothetical protein [Pseudomonas paralactis]